MPPPLQGRRREPAAPTASSVRAVGVYRQYLDYAAAEQGRAGPICDLEPAQTCSNSSRSIT
jgi:hypothetical protein